MPQKSPSPLRRHPTPSEPIDVEALSALLLRSGPNGRSPRHLAEALLVRFDGLHGLRRASVRELTSLDGVGPVTAARIQAALVLGRRAVEVVRELPGPYRGAHDVYEYLRPRVAHSEKETFYVLLLDSKNKLIREEVVSVGTLTASLVHPREVFCPAVREAAAAIIVAHNHPSGDPKASAEDIEVTSRLRAAGQVIGIPLLDHVIIGAGQYVSLAEQGRMKGGG